MSLYLFQTQPFHCQQTQGDLRLTAVKASSPLLVVMAATEAVVVVVAAVGVAGVVAVELGGSIVVVVVVVGIVARLDVTVVVMEHVLDMRKRQHPTWGMREVAIVGSRTDVGTSRAP